MDKSEVKEIVKEVLKGLSVQLEFESWDIPSDCIKVVLKYNNDEISSDYARIPGLKESDE